MSQFDFDTVIDRRGTGSLKFDFAQERGRPADVLPLWVADMDFKAPPTVLEALRRRVDHGIFGYSDVKEDYVRAVSGWFRDRFGWQPQPQWLVRTPGVVYALAMAVRARPSAGRSTGRAIPSSTRWVWSPVRRPTRRARRGLTPAGRPCAATSTFCAPS